MSCPSKITLVLTDKLENTIAKFFINWETDKLEDVRIFLTDDGTGVIHELIELNLIETALENNWKIVDYNWDFCRNIFHMMAIWSLE